MTDDPYRVVVVDDDVDVANFISTVLRRRAGCEVRTLNDPLAVLAEVEAFQPDVVVTDIEMPGISGLELVGRLREAVPGIPIVVMTAHITLDYAMQAMKSQADELLTKPIASKDLVEVVTRLGAENRRRNESHGEQQRAAEVQQSLLPKNPIDLDGYELRGGCSPARAVGGDFFDWYPVAGGASFTLADVMGKGTGAAIIAATVRAVLRSGSGDTELATAIAEAARTLESDLEHAGSFVTMFHARLDTQRGVVRYIDAGHGLSLVVRADGTVKRLATTSLPLGLGLEEGWREHEVALAVGDVLVSVSDGVLDLFDGSLTSLDRVEALVRASDSAQDVVDALLAAVPEDSAVAVAPDDVTAVVLRRLA